MGTNEAASSSPVFPSGLKGPRTIAPNPTRWRQLLARLSVRGRNGLKRGNIRNFEELQAKSNYELVQIPSLGRITMLEIVKSVQEIAAQNEAYGPDQEKAIPEKTSPVLNSKALPYGGSAVLFLEVQLSAMRERERIIFLEACSLAGASFGTLAQRFGVSIERVRELLMKAQRQFWRRARHSLIKVAEQQLLKSSQVYIPNSGGFPALDGPLDKILQIAAPLRWVASRSKRQRLIFIEEKGFWGLSTGDPSAFNALPPRKIRSQIREWNIYIVRCRDNTLYTGISRNVDERVRQHSLGKGARYTSTRCPVKLVYRESRMRTCSDALKRERKIKKLSRQEKESLISRQLRKAQVKSTPQEPPSSH